MRVHNKRHRLATLGIASLTVLSAMSAAAVATAQTAESFFKTNNKITLGAPSNAGGGYDTYTRLVARHITKYLPEGSSIVVQNVPAAGGMALANMVYNTAPKDGTYLGMVRGTTIQEHIYANPAVMFDGRKFQWIGNMNSDYDGCIVAASTGMTSVADFYKREVVVGASGAGAQSYSFPIIYNEILGTKFKVISGYAGTPERFLAMERGELHGACGITTSTLRATLAQPYREGKILLLAQGGGKKDPHFPDVPNMLDEAKTAEARQALDFMLGTQELGRAFAAAPQTPLDRVAYLRGVFDRTIKDSDLLEDAKKLQLDIDPMDGAASAAVIDRMYVTPAAIVERLRAALARKQG